MFYINSGTVVDDEMTRNLIEIEIIIILLETNINFDEPLFIKKYVI